MYSAFLRRTLFCLFLLPWPLYGSEPLRIVTEELPPYSMTVNGKLGGMATELVQAVLDEIGESTHIQVMPWARAYDTALNGHNVLIYSIARTPAREALFTWVEPIAAGNWKLYSLNPNLRLNSLDEARHYQIATVKDDVAEQFLLDHGFEIGKNLQSSNRYDLNYEKLLMGRVDLWIVNETNANYIVRQVGQNPAQTLYPVLDLDNLGGSGLNMAFSRNTSAETISRFRQGLEKARANGKLQAIYAKWQ
ncbi:Amino acid ABC transporter substrate-binding protein [Pseudomonas sp. 8Z]|uniref:substrate-binding periplasmic protein n=1 Tax=Pseudomonas sp. 8Z TaxID=2653166 RepID=UPI0012F091E2|nr:transporter substrate-binding domain-containing protein [Pseudomonas sp. 8Z]VXC80288.1 Amino acid ABC transporter substrate-binding protein [Pseudomonas sp. 8Z]